MIYYYCPANGDKYISLGRLCAKGFNFELTHVCHYQMKNMKIKISFYFSLFSLLSFGKFSLVNFG